LEGWLRAESADDQARAIAQQADLAERSFNERFWYAEGGHLYDVIDGENGADPACRPNQLFAISLPHPVLAEERWPAVLHVVAQAWSVAEVLRCWAITSGVRGQESGASSQGSGIPEKGVAKCVI